MKGEPIRFIPGHQNKSKTGRGYKKDRYKVEDRGFETPCWVWLLAQTGKGYGCEWDNGRGRMVGAHILAFERTNGPVPIGLELDHLCKVRLCVNPEHLEAVTHAENVRRGDRLLNNWNAHKTHCPHGHPYSEENTYLSKGARKCRTCVLERARKYRELRRAR